ncbi:MAG: very short patch repair endonuclease [Armatimonadota bacterium]
MSNIDENRISRDPLTPAQRSKCMSRVKNKNTNIEVKLRSAIHSEGFRFLKHVKELPGTPDLVFTRAKLAVFIDGDFWHGYRFNRLKLNLKPFWRDKIQTNRQRDIRNFCALRDMGWRVIRIWQHEIKKDLPKAVRRVLNAYHLRINANKEANPGKV